MTAKEIIRSALRQINAIDATDEPTAADYQACLEYLNNILDSWSAEGFLIYYYSREEFTMTAAKSVYTIGTGGDFNTSRPAYIDSAQLQYPNSDVDYNIEVVPQNMFDLASVKTVQGQPRMLFYNPEYPLGKLHFYYTPDQAYALRLNLRQRLSSISNIANTVAFPEEYRRALVFNLAVDVANMYGFDAPQDTKRIARESKDTVMSRNAANDASIAEFDTAMRRTGRRRGVTRGEFFGGD
jgi:hypothetical protein